MQQVLVVGGAGFIGSHMVLKLQQNGFEPIVFDNLSTGFRDSVADDVEFFYGDLANRDALNKIFKAFKFDAVMHFASFTQVGESVENPAKYYFNNVVTALNLLEAMRENNINNLIFSSTAAVYGEPKETPIKDSAEKNPLNPYGRTKLMVEQILQDYAKAYDLRSICLRYFNAAGALENGLLGERHNPETHLIPLILQAASGRREAISVFGNDYSTPDGTCIRDYIHVDDLCAAHLLALNKLLSGAKSTAYNLGNGKGFSVMEVINAAKKVTQWEIKVIQEKRRAGDPAVLVADAIRAKKELGWQPKYTDLETIIKHAWLWEQHLKALTIQH